MLFKYIRHYFIGNLLKQAEDAVEVANVRIAFNIIVLILLAMIPLQVLYLIQGFASQIWIGFSTILIFGGMLFYMRVAKKVFWIVLVLIWFSIGVLCYNLFTYSTSVLTIGLHLACNLVFSFYLLPRKASIWTAFAQTAIFVLYFVGLMLGWEWITAFQVEMPLVQQFVRFLVMNGVLITMIVYYQGAYKQVAQRLKHTLTNVTEAKSAAEEMNRLKSTFLANMSHEIRTPLNGVLGINELLRDYSSDPELAEYLDIQYQSGQRLLNTIDSILSLSKLEADQSFFQLVKVDLISVAQEVESNQRVLAKNENIELKVIRPEQPVIALVDEGMMYQVLSNLVGNALKFTDPEGYVHIAVWHDKAKDRCMVSVKDNGIGMSDEFLTKLFEPFEQESEGRSKQYEGTGLGLSISKKFIELMGGTITVKSKLGEGSEFTISLPSHDTNRK